MLIGSKTGEHMVVDTVCGDAIWQSESCRKVIGRLSESYRKVIGRFVAMPYGLWQCHRACGGYGCRVGFYRLLRFVRFCQLFSTFLNSSRFLSGFIGFYVLSGFVRFCHLSGNQGFRWCMESFFLSSISGSCVVRLTLRVRADA